MSVILIIWFVIKVLLCALLLLAAFMLFLVALILFVPIRYEADGQFQKNPHMEYGISARFSWLFHFVRAYVTKNEGRLQVRLYVLAYQINKKKPTVKSASRPDKKAEAKPKAKEQPARRAKSKSRAKVSEKEKKTEQDQNNEKGENLLSKSAHMYDNIKEWKDTNDYKAILKHTQVLVKRLWRAIKPQSLTIEGEIGFSDPADTGKFLALESMLIGFTHHTICIRGNFYEEMLQANGRLQGKLRLGMLCLPLAAFLLSKPVWPIVKSYLFPTRKK